MIRRPPRSTLRTSSAASDVYKRQDRQTDRETDNETDTQRENTQRHRDRQAETDRTTRIKSVTETVHQLLPFPTSAATMWCSLCPRTSLSFVSHSVTVQRCDTSNPSVYVHLTPSPTFQAEGSPFKHRVLYRYQRDCCSECHVMTSSSRLHLKTFVAVCAATTNKCYSTFLECSPTLLSVQMK